MFTGVVILAALWLICAAAAFCVASRLARQHEEHFRHAHWHKRKHWARRR